MKHLKSFKHFENNATGINSGMGSIVSSQPSTYAGSLNGVDFNNGGLVGSGDIGVVLNGKKRKKRSARDVSDMRFLGSDAIGNFKVKKVTE